MSKKSSECRLIWKGDILTSAIDKGSADKLEEIGYMIENGLKEVISGKGTGRIYRYGKSKRKHQSSAPGEPPVTWGGELKDSIGHVVMAGKFIVSLFTGMTADHSFWLEYGTRKMKKRPFAKITFEKLSPEIKAELTKYGWLNKWTH